MPLGSIEELLHITTALLKSSASVFFKTLIYISVMSPFFSITPFIMKGNVVIGSYQRSRSSHSLLPLPIRKATGASCILCC